MADSLPCHLCLKTAAVVIRCVPYQAQTLFDAAPTNIRACAEHIEQAKRVGTVISMTPLSESVTVRTLHA